jgi:hypothetical protein
VSEAVVVVDSDGTQLISVEKEDGSYYAYANLESDVSVEKSLLAIPYVVYENGKTVYAEATLITR